MRTVFAVIFLLLVLAAGGVLGLAYCDWFFANVHGPLWWMWVNAVADLIFAVEIPLRLIAWGIKLSESH